MINLHIKYQDGTEKDVTAVAADFIAFEAKFDRSAAGIDKDPRLTYFYFFAYSVEKRTGATKLDFEKWTETVEEVSAIDSKK
jgi:hypothetical protein